MRTRLIQGTLAVVLPALLLGCSRAAEDAVAPLVATAEDPEPAPIVQGKAAAPQTKFGIKEALQPDRTTDPQAAANHDAQQAAAVAAGAAREAAKAAGGGPTPQQVAPAPKIAYAYSFGFEVSASSMAQLLRKHVAICEKLGPQRCRVMQMSQSGFDDYASGQVEIEVASTQAKAFGDELGKAAEGAGGKQVSSAISGEDLSKQIVDTEARLQARMLLRGRLMGLLASHNGSVAELVEAERAVADVNQEIDEAQRMLKELNGRVEFSRVTIDYQSNFSGRTGFLAPIAAAFRNLGAILGMVVAGLIVVTVSLVPIALFFFAWRWTWRRGKTVFGRLAIRTNDQGIAKVDTGTDA